MFKRGHTKPIEARFLGQARQCQVTCSSCSAKKILHMNGASSFPPNVIVKKLRQAGWLIGNKAKDDLCPECYRKPVAVAAIQAKKVLAHMAAPMMTNGHGQAIHYSEVEAIALKLPYEQMRQLIKALREALPAPSKSQRTPKAPLPVESDEEYALWLETLK
jgi:hypothetical protein